MKPGHRRKYTCTQGGRSFGAKVGRRPNEDEQGLFDVGVRPRFSRRGKLDDRTGGRCAGKDGRSRNGGSRVSRQRCGVMAWGGWRTAGLTGLDEPPTRVERSSGTPTRFLRNQGALQETSIHRIIGTQYLTEISDPLGI